ncbi:unnamed protein product [Paramecium pentaurelia]|uniref:Transmembrane protein n=1 Tax=Paramecium pentaurelia TaxID=43138 RepID=A0A8S1TJC8_9CILI|nr:unnamed protein product [Paramecium pentaurelia]
MQRTDVLANRISILIAFLLICILIAVFGRQSNENQAISERFEPEVSESEIRYFLENDINFNDSDQFGIQTIQDWLPIQSELAQLNLALEYFSRLNLDKILNKHVGLEEQVNQCLELHLNQELEKYVNQINSSSINQTINSDALFNYNVLFEKKIQLNEAIFNKKAQLDILSAEEKDLKQICTQYQLNELETIKLDNKIKQFQKYSQDINYLEQKITDSNYKIQQYLQEQGNQEDLTKEYQKDQELAKIMSKLFKPTGTKSVEIHDEKLGGILNVLDKNMKQYNTTEVFLNGLNFHREIQKNYLEEMQLIIQRDQSSLEYKRREKNNLEKEIEDLEKQKKEKNENYQNAVSRLEEIRRSKIELNNLTQIERQELDQVIYELKNYNPQSNLQNDEKLDAQKKFKEYLYLHLKEDQLCVEKCIEYDSLNQQINIGRYRISLKSIQKHFSELELKFKEFKI